MGADQRQSPRKELRIKALVTMDGATAHVFVQTKDIARFGMGLIGIAEPLPANAQGLISFELFLDGAIRHVDVKFRIAYCIPDGPTFRAGIQFLNLDSAGAAMIAQYVAD
jgi:hypothetical protein